MGYPTFGVTKQTAAVGEAEIGAGLLAASENVLPEDFAQIGDLRVGKRLIALKIRTAKKPHPHLGLVDVHRQKVPCLIEAIRSLHEIQEHIRMDEIMVISILKMVQRFS